MNKSGNGFSIDTRIAANRYIYTTRFIFSACAISGVIGAHIAQSKQK